MTYYYSSIQPRQWTSGVWKTVFGHFLMGIVAPLACEIHRRGISENDDVVLGGLTEDDIARWGKFFKKLRWRIALKTTIDIYDTPLLSFDFQIAFPTRQFELPPYLLLAVRNLLDIEPPSASPTDRVFVDRVGLARKRKDDPLIRSALKDLGFIPVDFSGCHVIEYNIPYHLDLPHFRNIAGLVGAKYTKVIAPEDGSVVARIRDLCV